jgi:hypothetical protein
VADRWIVIPNWDRFQHYKNRDPLWIKLHRSLASDPDWMGLSGHDRAVLVGLWMEYASSNRRIRLDTSSISSRLTLRVTKASLERLQNAGLIEVSASRPLAQIKKEEKRRKGLTSTEDQQENGEAAGYQIPDLLKELP